MDVRDRTFGNKLGKIADGPDGKDCKRQSKILYPIIQNTKYRSQRILSSAKRYKVNKLFECNLFFACNSALASAKLRTVPGNRETYSVNDRITNCRIFVQHK